MYEKAVVDKLCSLLSGISATVIPASDFTTERDENMVVVSVASTENVLPCYNDYKLQAEVLIDCYVTEDTTATNFYAIKEAVDKTIFDISKEFPTFTSFGSIPVVGFIINDDALSLTDKSNVCTKRIDIFISYDEEKNN